ncbi:MAG: rhomboid family intramembrane serine protease [Thermodesulfobacteriota bacterium]
MKNPGAWYKNIFLLSGVVDGVFLTRLIIGINIFFYVLSLVLSSSGISLSGNPLNFLSPDNRVLIFLGAGGEIPVDRLGYWWSFISASYLHGSVLHIIFNMIAFSQLFYMVLNFYGVSRSFIIYSASGITGFLLSYLSGTSLTIGASASICGLIGALLFYGKSRGGVYGEAVYKQVSGWIISLVIFGLLIPGIDNFGHLGGFLGGVAAGFILGYSEKRPENFINKITAFIFMIATAGVLFYSAFNGLDYIF